MFFSQRLRFLGIVTVLSAPASHADITLSNGSWSTTFKCADQKQGDAQWLTCDGLSSYGAWTASTGEVEQITPLANMSAGGGGSGQRHWIGAGHNNNSGSAVFCLPAFAPELWIRFYTRWQAGYFMSAQQSQKLIYAWDTAGRPYIDTYGSDGIRMVTNSTIFSGTTGVWNTIMGGSMSDGKWHEFQFHLKAAGTNGGGDVWVDGRNVLSFTGFDWGSITGWRCIRYPENVDINATGTTMYQDIDDLAVSTQGYIPSIVPASAPKPLPPTNLVVK